MPIEEVDQLPSESQMVETTATEVPALQRNDTFGVSEGGVVPQDAAQEDHYMK